MSAEVVTANVPIRVEFLRVDPHVLADSRRAPLARARAAVLVARVRIGRPGSEAQARIGRRHLGERSAPLSDAGVFQCPCELDVAFERTPRTRTTRDGHAIAELFLEPLLGEELSLDVAVKTDAGALHVLLRECRPGELRSASLPDPRLSIGHLRVRCGSRSASAVRIWTRA